MIVTGVVRGDELDQVSAEGSTYEEAKNLMLSRVPEGQRLIAIHTDRYS
ncbi:hypothetical protein PTW37_17040 (plasmid) [Arthrobacter agilis]|nr:hypothetical protein [Arthrobacter agilis]WDF35054.1 hypothetical protein PTW37_17040 [Arthrobacter agilis]